MDYNKRYRNLRLHLEQFLLAETKFLSTSEGEATFTWTATTANIVLDII